MNVKRRSWMITLPAAAYSRDDVVAGLGCYTGVVGQLERGEQRGFLHWQLLVDNRTPIAFSTLRNKFPKGHFEERRGSIESAVAYVTKEATRVGEVISLGVIRAREQGKRGDLEVYGEMIKNGASPSDVVRAFPSAARFDRALGALLEANTEELARKFRDLRVFYVYGDPGVGKTRFVMSFAGDGGVYRVSDYVNPFDKYTREKVLLLDEFSGRESDIRFKYLLQLLEGHPLQLRARYRNPWALYETVYMVSNLPFTALYRDVSGSEWLAFLRRITGVYRMLPGEKMVCEAAPAAWFAGGVFTPDNPPAGYLR